MNKYKSRKFVLTWVVITIIVVLQLVASLTKTDCTTAIITIASVVGFYNITNVIQKRGGENE
ncbi:MAG: hypothetical protein QXG00_06125 [Candidatus Woesearchaeota archaeon]